MGSKLMCMPEEKYEKLMALGDAAIEWARVRGEHDMREARCSWDLYKAAIAYRDDDSKIEPKRGEPAPFFYNEED